MLLMRVRPATHHVTVTFLVRAWQVVVLVFPLGSGMSGHSHSDAAVDVAG